MTEQIANPPKRGRPPKQPPADAVKQIEKLAAEGATIVGIARALRTSADTLARWREEYPEIQAAIDNGRDVLHFELQNLLLQKARNGDTVALLFYLKSRFGWREGDQSETANRVTINFQLPGAISMEEFTKAKIINANASDRTEPVSTKRLTRT